MDSQTIQALRADLVQALDTAGFAINTTYGYTPHITLAYLPQGTPLPDVRLPNIAATLDHVWCCIGDHRYAYPLGKLATVDRAALAIDVARRLKAELLCAVEL
ncbi:MAG: 2'-5' RNA ligase family protein [Ktedonobacterales bacterium]|nr:2'-5' RNA ligase family protein [Ktedonobacterales bacterium]